MNEDVFNASIRKFLKAPRSQPLQAERRLACDQMEIRPIIVLRSVQLYDVNTDLNPECAYVESRRFAFRPDHRLEGH